MQIINSTHQTDPALVGRDGYHVRDHVTRCLQGKGYGYLGAGCFGTVLSDPADPTKVVKVGCYGRAATPDGLPADGWVHYVRACADHPSPHAPRVESIEFFPTYYVARMERLEEGTDELRSKSSITRGIYPSRLPGPLGEFGAWIEAALPDHSMDCHTGNIMFRADGTPVITDPVC